MKKVLISFLLLALCFPQVLKAQNESKPFVHCIVLDKTLSMVGRDGTKEGTTNIWADVQNYCCGMVDGFVAPSTVVLYTFDSGLFGPNVFEIKKEADKEAVKDKVRSIKVDGQATWIASNLAKVINALYKQYPGNNIMIYLLTDGIEEQQPCNIQKVVDDYHAYVGDYDHLYYVDLRSLLSSSNNTTSKQFKDAFENGSNTDIVDGYPEIVNLSTMFKTIPYEVKENEENQSKFVVTQLFEVTSGELTKDFSFTAKILEGEVKGANFTITPSKVSLDNMKPFKGEKGKYSVDFEIENISKVSLFSCNIPVQLKGCTGKNTLTVEPSRFVIEFTKQPEKEKITIIEKDTVKILEKDTVTIYEKDTVVVEHQIIIEPEQKPQKVGVKPNKYQKNHNN